MSTTRILGICGSQRNGGNCEQSLAEALKASKTVDEIETEQVNLAGLNINHCNGCYRCQYSSTQERPCPEFDDAMTALYQKILDADGYIFATPVYFGSVTSTMKAFMDRTTPLTCLYNKGNSTRGLKSILRLRPATGIAISAARNDGIETTLVTIFRYFLYHDMMPVGSQTINNKYAGSFGGAIVSDDKPNAIGRDRAGIGTLHAIGKKVAILSKSLKPVRMTLLKQTF